MKRGIIALVLIVLFCSLISAEIIFSQPIKQAYNLGDSVFVPVTIKALNDISGDLQVNLICNGTPINFYKNGIKLSSGEEKTLDSSLILIKSIIGDVTGICKIKAILNGEYKLTEEFQISDLLIVDGRLEKTEFNAGESISIKGKITRETEENSNGIIEATLIGEENISQTGTVNEGTFNINISLPKNLKAGIYPIEVKAYEKNSDGTITNTGITTYSILIKQVPTNLELIFESNDIEPGTSIKVKAVLHDQTGESIESTATITIKDYNNKIVEQKLLDTEAFLEYSIASDESPADWEISSVSNNLTTESLVRIKEKESVRVEIINKTIVIKNDGNVPYNKTLLVKIENTSLNILVKLGVGESKKYVVSAPQGDYKVRVVTNDEDNPEVNEVMSLTGGVTGIKEASNISLGVLGWVVLILILIVTIFVMIKKIYKKQFTGKKMFGLKNKFNEKSSGQKENFKKMTIGEGLTMIQKIGSKAELSLSIKGEKQDASMICVKVRNLREVKSGRGSGAESIAKIVDVADENKAVVYENQDYLFLILAPLKTRTMKNEKLALDLAEKVELILADNNRKFHQKIDYGISLSHGSIVAKVENNTFKFMTMGTFMTEAKKIASVSKGEILLSTKINDLLRLQIKTEKSVRDGTSVFNITRIKRENEEARQFINKFMERQKKG